MIGFQSNPMLSLVQNGNKSIAHARMVEELKQEVFTYILQPSKQVHFNIPTLPIFFSYDGGASLKIELHCNDVSNLIACSS